MIAKGLVQQTTITNVRNRIMYFSKSKYTSFCQCPKIIWLSKNKPEELSTDESTMARFESGNEVGDLAMGYFGDFVEVTAYKDGKLDLAKMIENTKAEIAKGTPVICEASFNFGGLYCAVDILHSESGGWSIYEVKSSTHADKDVYMYDIAYQKYVLEKCGLNITGTYLMCIDNTYVFDGTLDIRKLFKVTDVSERVAEMLPNVDPNLMRAEEILAEETEPNIGIGLQCSNPYECGFLNYCTRNITKPNVFDLYRINGKTKFEFYNSGVYTFEALEKEKSIKNKIQRMQIDHYLHDRDTHADKENLRKFLDELTYPLYFLDFESVQPIVPKYVGTRPYAQIPFQYSLHYIESDGGELMHKEFLAEAGTDPLRPIAEALCRDIPMNVTVIAYNMSFERGRLKELAGYFPDLSEPLMNIQSNIVDLIVPFRNGWYYNKRMGGSFSIKSVLPAIFPDDPSFDYHNLEGIHNGGEAMNAFPAMEKMSPEKLEVTRRNLLKYCELDTLAMVKVWEALREAVE